MTKRLIAGLVATSMLAGCGGGADPAQVVETIRATEQSQLQSIESDDLVGIARLYADDAVLVRPDGSVLEGGEAIAHAYGDLLEDPNFALEVEPQGGWASTAEDLAVIKSHVNFTTTDAETGEASTMPMVSQTVWTRAAGGSWMIVSAINAPAPVEESPAE